MDNPKITIDDVNVSSNDRFHRFKLIGWWNQDRLKQAKILVIGAGALGNEIVKNLALLGVGNILIADLDKIENSNLSRSILYREKDNGKPKAQVAAQAAKDIYPDINVHWFQGNVVYDLGLGVFRWADVIIGGLDNREARLAINRAAYKVGKPWINGAIEQLNGVAKVFIPPEGPCYECTMSDKDWELLRMRRSCALLTRDQMLEGKVPTTPTSASIIAGIQCQEAVKLLHGLDTLAGKGIVFNGMTHDIYTVEYTRKEDCYSHDFFGQIFKINKGVEDVTFLELLKLARRQLGSDTVIELNNDVLVALNCKQCNKKESIFRSLGKVTEKEGLCPICGQKREVITVGTIYGDEDFIDKNLAEIGIPSFDILTCRNGGQRIHLELGDKLKVLGPLFKEQEHATTAS